MTPRKSNENEQPLLELELDVYGHAWVDDRVKGHICYFCGCGLRVDEAMNECKGAYEVVLEFYDYEKIEEKNSFVFASKKKKSDRDYRRRKRRG